jgi:pimeloyl-ACP methyl ester carboxylesterase
MGGGCACPAPPDRPPHPISGVIDLHGIADFECALSAQAGISALIAPDLSGYGASRGFADADYPLDNQVERLHEFLQAAPETHGKAVFLAGNSIGGAIASRYAARYPESVKTLALFAPIGMEGGIGWSDECKALQGAGGRAIPNASFALSESLAHRHERRGQNLPTPCPADAGAVGEQERLLRVPPPAAAINACLPDSELATLPASGHLSHLDNPAALVARYAQFLNQTH